jgi:hypothetical protein
MKLKLLTIFFAFVVLTPTPTFAAPPWVEDYCWAQAAQTRFNGRGEREAFIANCIADHTATPQTKRRSYKKPRY